MRKLKNPAEVSHAGSKPYPVAQTRTKRHVRTSPNLIPYEKILCSKGDLCSYLPDETVEFTTSVMRPEFTANGIRQAAEAGHTNGG